jgi:signal transduction histidine kinase
MIERYILVLLAGIFLLAIQTTQLWPFRRVPGAVELILCSISCDIWLVGYALEVLSPDLPQKLFWAKFQYLGISTISVWVFMFMLRYTGKVSRHTPWYIGLLLVIPLCTILFAATNETYHLLWTSVSLQHNLSGAPLVLDHGWWFWVIISYSYILLMSGMVIFLRFVFRTQAFHLPLALLMLLSMLAPWVGNTLFILNIRPGANLDLTPIGFTITNLGLGIGFSSFRLLDLLPVAYSSIFRFMSDGVVVLDTQKRIIDLNPIAIQIFRKINPAQPKSSAVSEKDARSSFVGKWMDHLLPEWAGAQQDEQEIRFGQSFEETYQVYTLRTTPILDQRQQTTGWVLIFTDITRLKRTEEELMQAHEQALESNRLKTKLLANVSHDMRTPLRSIIGYTDMLRDGVYGDLSTDQKTAWANVQDNANQLLLFVNNLIGQAQFDNEKILLNPRWFSVQELISACQSSVNLMASKKGLAVVYETAPDLPKMLFGDPYWLRQILVNLIHNAVKFTNQGSVKLRIFFADSMHWAIEVTDTGIGFPDGAKATILHRSEQTDPSISQESTGSGLGLTIVKELTGLMGGKISLTSQPGSGSTVLIRFPYVTGELSR